jgi:hypothetical protein
LVEDRDSDRSGSRPKLSYAEITRASAQSHALVVRATDPEKSSDDIEGMIKKNINLKVLGMGVNRIRKSSKKCLLMEVETEDQRELLKNEINGKLSELRAEDGKKKNPLVLFKGVVKGLTEQELNDSLVTQNRKLKVDEILKVKYRRRHRNSLLSNIVCQVSPLTWRILTEAGKVHIGYQSIDVENEIPLVQCFKCLAFGHTQVHCKRVDNVCAKCSEHHDTRNCSVTEERFKCVNCILRGRERVLHCATDRGCPIRLTFEKKSIEGTNYIC